MSAFQQILLTSLYVEFTQITTCNQQFLPTIDDVTLVKEQIRFQLIGCVLKSKYWWCLSSKSFIKVFSYCRKPKFRLGKKATTRPWCFGCFRMVVESNEWSLFSYNRWCSIRERFEGFMQRYPKWNSIFGLNRVVEIHVGLCFDQLLGVSVWNLPPLQSLSSNFTKLSAFVEILTLSILSIKKLSKVSVIREHESKYFACVTAKLRRNEGGIFEVWGVFPHINST